MILYSSNNIYYYRIRKYRNERGDEIRLFVPNYLTGIEYQPDYLKILHIRFVQRLNAILCM